MKKHIVNTMFYIGSALSIIGLLMTGICMFWQPISALYSIGIAFIGIFLIVFAFLIDPEQTVKSKIIK